MSEENYNKIAHLFQFLNNNPFHDYQYGMFDGSYKGYKKELVQLGQDSMQFIQKLKNFKVQDFYNHEYLTKNGFPEKYYNGELVAESNSHYGFHYQTNTILFAYILHQLREVAKSFLELINSQDFDETLGHLVKKDKYEFKYPTEFHKTVFSYLNSRVKNFAMLHHQLNWLTDMSYSDGSYTYYKVERLKNFLTKLDIFNFENVNLID